MDQSSLSNENPHGVAGRYSMDKVTFGVAAGPDVSPGCIGMYAAGRWQVLTPRERRSASGVAGLDVTVLDDQVLRPLVGIQGGDPRLEFIPELRNLEPTVSSCDEDGGVLFTLHAPRLDDLISVAERREFMSAKTTYVKPKPRTGVFLQGAVRRGHG